MLRHVGRQEGEIAFQCGSRCSTAGHEDQHIVKRQDSQASPRIKAVSDHAVCCWVRMIRVISQPLMAKKIPTPHAGEITVADRQGVADDHQDPRDAPQSVQPGIIAPYAAGGTAVRRPHSSLCHA